MSNYKSFEELACWQEARKLRNHVSKNVIIKFPVSEKYNLRDQILRSSRSIGGNVAEGFGRFHYQENIQFCRIARGSLYETLDHMIVAIDENYIKENDLQDFKERFNKCLLILNGYIKYLKDKKGSNN